MLHPLLSVFSHTAPPPTPPPPPPPPPPTHPVKLGPHDNPKPDHPLPLSQLPPPHHTHPFGQPAQYLSPGFLFFASRVIRCVFHSPSPHGLMAMRFDKYPPDVLDVFSGTLLVHHFPRAHSTRDKPRSANSLNVPLLPPSCSCAIRTTSFSFSYTVFQIHIPLGNKTSCSFNNIPGGWPSFRFFSFFTRPYARVYPFFNHLPRLCIFPSERPWKVISFLPPPFLPHL